MQTIFQDPTLYTAPKATEIAKALRSGELDGWTYTVECDDCVPGLFLVRVRDENGDTVGFWGDGDEVSMYVETPA